MTPRVPALLPGLSWPQSIASNYSRTAMRSAPCASHDAARIESHWSSPGCSYATGVIMPETRYALFVLGVGAGFFIAMYEWVTMIAEAMP